MIYMKIFYIKRCLDFARHDKYEFTSCHFERSAT